MKGSNLILMFVKTKYKVENDAGIKRRYNYKKIYNSKLIEMAKNKMIFVSFRNFLA